MDYYSYKPLVSLERPVVIAGVPGTDVLGITRMLGSFTGLPVLLSDRKLAHALGHHPDRLTAEDRHRERWEIEQRLLGAAFAGGPLLVSLTSHSMLREGALGWLRERALTVWLKEEPAVVLERVVQDVARDPNRHWLVTRGETIDPAAFLRELAAHEVVLAGCERVFEARRQASHGIARDLLEPLGLEPMA